jgi:hypothetical protein
MKIKAVARQAEFNSDKSLFLSDEIVQKGSFADLALTS